MCLLQISEATLEGELGHGHPNAVLHSLWVPHGDEYASGCVGRGAAQ